MHKLFRKIPEENKEKGQTMVEYIMLIAVVTIVLLGIFRNLEAYMVSNPDSFLNRYLGGFSATFSQGNGSYKFFTIRR